MPKTLILPGLHGSPAPHWQHWWAATDPTALIVEQQDWDKPTHEAWEADLAGAILTHPGCILVGHSLGAILAARILTRWPQLNVSAVLLVAPADPEKSSRLASFRGLPDQPLGVPATLVASRNDPWMSFSQSREIAATWGAEFIDLGFAGHINVDSGFGPWPAALALRDALAERAGLPILPRTATSPKRAIA